MDEPILTADEKQQWVDALNDVKNRVNGSSYKDVKKELQHDVTLSDTACNIRNSLCYVMMEQKSISVHDCALCWINWFIHDHEGRPTVSDQRIIDVFNKMFTSELEKRIYYSCYTISFEAIEVLDKTKIIDMANLMITYLQT
jgi:hypothetical protein